MCFFSKKRNFRNRHLPRQINPSSIFEPRVEIENSKKQHAGRFYYDQKTHIGKQKKFSGKISSHQIYDPNDEYIHFQNHGTCDDHSSDEISNCHFDRSSILSDKLSGIEANNNEYIKQYRFTKIGKIGNGSFGIVFLSRDEMDEKLV